MISNHTNIQVFLANLLMSEKLASSLLLIFVSNACANELNTKQFLSNSLIDLTIARAYRSIWNMSCMRCGGTKMLAQKYFECPLRGAGLVVIRIDL